MKKYLVLTFTLLVFLININKSIAQCHNWIHMTTIFGYVYIDPLDPNQVESTCQVVLEYEYCCEATGIGFGIRITDFHYADPMCNLPIDDEFFHQAEQAMLKDFVTRVNCIEPCTSENWTQHEAHVYIPKCWKEINDPEQMVIRFEECPSTTECVYVYKVCYYYDENNEINLNFILDEVYTIPGETCTNIGAPIFTGDPTVYWESDCFIFYSDCPAW